jgi:hypothetical protein
VSVVVFLGPSLAPSRALDCGFDLRPPVRQGDVLRAVAAGATHIGIVDGYFDQVPSVWHKEILFAMERGVVVYGAASMGALRAAELHTFGMIGVGRVFEMYREGELEDDDEVALLHAPEDEGYRPGSEAMVNLRDLVDAAVAAGALDRAVAQRVIAGLKAAPYAMRTKHLLLELAPPSETLTAFVRAPRALVKARDALALLERIAHDASQGEAPGLAPRQDFHVERTVFLERLKLEIARERQGGDATQPNAGTHAALLGLLAREHAALLGATPTNDDVDAQIDELRRAHGLETPEAVDAWLASRGMTVDRLFELARERATVQLVAARLRLELTLGARDRIEWPDGDV